MSDFLSRLVGRTFGLKTVVQPVIGSIFTPELSVKNDYMHDLVYESKAVSSQNDIHTDSSRKTKIERYHGQPALNSDRSFGKDYPTSTDQIEAWDNQNGFSSISKQQHKREQDKPFKQNYSGFQEQTNSQEQIRYQEPTNFEKQTNSQEQIKSLPLHRIIEDHQYPHKPPVELAQDNKSLYENSSDSSGPAESGILYAEDRNYQGISRLFPEPMLSEEQFYVSGQASQRYQESVSNNIGSLTGKKLLSHVSELTLISGDPSNLKSDGLILKAGEPTSKANSGLPGHPLDIQPLPVIPSRHSLGQLSTQKASAIREQTGKTLMEKRFLEPISPSTRPTIKVTIGRIEVRAVKPTVTQQPQAPPPQQHPILSLDDYLRQYNG